VHSARLEAAGSIKPAEIEAMRSRIEAEIDEAVAFAEAGTLEPVEDLERDVYAASATPVKETSS
jgi:TPP-dependent pyruvate/acetoin dehydrogenase alpha subunit